MRSGLLSAIGILFIGLIPGCATLPGVDRPEIQAVHPRITGIDFQGVNLDFDVDVYNPYPVAIRTPRFRYGLDVEGSNLFDSETASGLDLPARAVGTTVLPVRLAYSDLLSHYRTLADAPEANYRLHGALLLSSLGQSFELPLSHEGTFPILRPPTFSDVKFQLADVSLTKAKFNIDAAVNNPNIFTLGLEDLGYVLKLGDIKLGGLTAATDGSLDPGGTGRMSLSGEASVANTLFNLLVGGTAGQAQILPSGSIRTPYGKVNLQQHE